jgi:hypothetical protein
MGRIRMVSLTRVTDTVGRIRTASMTRMIATAVPITTASPMRTMRTGDGGMGPPSPVAGGHQASAGTVSAQVSMVARIASSA